MQTTTLSFTNFHNHGELFANMLRARRELFIVQNKWDLPEAMGMEYDQYDTPASRWVVVHDELGKVLAGNRLTPTTATCGIYSYMIRDAQRGLLATIPSDLLYDEAPVSETVWESSRLFVSHDVPMALRRKVHARLVQEIGNSARQLGASSALTLLNANWPRWAGRVGVDMTAMGPVMEIDGIKNQVVSMDFSQNLH
ncbi:MULTISPECIES: acyl-homoserine-lactone synthase [Thioclava]|uniref:acyl-homoserine-lactone synthase n=1 Tax=Thioclava nitratireducens TaxID=1915078 RepID=A0ABM6IE76_9RHOB|nr:MULTISPECIES: acyl-homoserine-lactone synthase [Thioclava]AQS47034.1 N-acyl-L-homoserine lactone synthetase [Thioclava nitratireducens]OWY00987.1 N-acyl-L-homoserine lactone synthetase [Thioclava sp. IC9]OWY01107.1 N-acyl-L-homoserine lactone synthetase [Thioclava sp. F1Mire-8]OWY08672.1 N-acyl-L-homoserine lactone synthetase [Thioclava sp. F42-5]OWY11833.1 N-acyl-L-homoserine lactone synthetase [Thioclava sp. F34-6]